MTVQPLPPPVPSRAGVARFAVLETATPRQPRARVGERGDRRAHALLCALLVLSFLLRMAWLASAPPDGLLIFDERFYVNAARVILGIPSGASEQDNPYVDSPIGLDPNTEHPPLAKLVVAGSMRLLGDNPLGWRVPSVLLGTASILLLYGIARRLGAGQDVALGAAGLFAFDNLVFVHSRIFTLDVFELAFMLLGAYWYLSGRPVLAGVGLALATLSKIGGASGLLALLAYEALRLARADVAWSATWRPVLKRLVTMGVVFGLVFLLGLGMLDRVWVGYTQPLEHLQRIFTHGTNLSRLRGPSEFESYPWQWLWNDTQMPYASTDQEVRQGDQVVETRALVQFRGAMNPFVLQLWPLGLCFAAWAWWRRRPGRELAALALAWFACTYLPFWAATLLVHRISYIFYFLPALPAVALAGSSFLLRAGLPRPIPWAYAAAVLLGFYGYFPFKFYGFPT